MTKADLIKVIEELENHIEFLEDQNDQSERNYQELDE